MEKSTELTANQQQKWTIKSSDAVKEAFVLYRLDGERWVQVFHHADYQIILRNFNLRQSQDLDKQYKIKRVVIVEQEISPL